MINTKKKIYIYNRYRYIYRSKNRYFIKYDRKYIDLFSIIKNSNISTTRTGTIKGGDYSKKFLKDAIDTIKLNIDVYKLIIEDKQKDAINIFNNLIILFNSQRDIIINKINSYPPEHFDNELNKSAIITFVKNILYNNIFNNYLVDIIPRLDLDDEIDDKIITDTIKRIIHHDENSVTFKNYENKIIECNNNIKDLRRENIDEYKILNELIKKSFETANEKFNSEQGEQSGETNDIKEIINIKNVIKSETDIIRDGLNDFKNYDWIDTLLALFKKEHNYYKNNPHQNYEEIVKYFENILIFLKSNINRYEEIIKKNKKDLPDYNNKITENNSQLQLKNTEIKNIETDKTPERQVQSSAQPLNQSNTDEYKKLKNTIAELEDEVNHYNIMIDIKTEENKNYTDNIEKIDRLYKLIEDTIKSFREKINNKIEKVVEKDSYIEVYKVYVRGIILFIKTNILFSFINNYNSLCEHLDSNKNDCLAKNKDLSDKLKKQADKTLNMAGGGNLNIKKNITICAYLTDVEGNLDYFHKYVRLSKVIAWVDSKKNRLRFKLDNSMFVFGGDAQDRGIGDIRFINLLLDFKKEYPDRVEFIIGNRDANKIRIYSELSEKITNNSAHLSKYDKFPYWVNKKDRVTLRNYLEQNNYEINIVNRLKYILEYTMGSSGSFEKRRAELAILLNKNASSISDEDIVTSFLNSISPHPVNIKNTNDNYLLKYLQYGKIAYIFGEHIFVHGAINKNNMGYVPSGGKLIEDVNLWISTLNNWYHKELNEYILNPEYGGITKKRKGYKIIDYSVPSDNRTVVYSDNLKNGNGNYINSKVIKYLNKSGIHSIISGHKPHGDCPLVLRSKNLTAVSADTSYSDKGHISKWGVDNRGNAVCEVLLYKNGDIQIHGILSDNSKYNYIIENKVVDSAKYAKKAYKYDRYIGIKLKNNYWVKNVKKSKYLISYAEGFDYDEKWVSVKELNELI
jgi:hypothetical protein